MTARAHILLLVALMAASLTAVAQSGRITDLGAIVGVNYAAEVMNKVELELEEEVRFENYQGTHFDRWLSELSLETPMPIRGLGNRLSGGCHLGYARQYDDKGYYDNRLRYGVTLTYRETVRRFRFSYRSRLMFTYRDERMGDYRVNPKWYWRHKLQATYQMPNSRFKYALSMELFLRLRENPEDVFFDQMRTVLSVNYRIARRQSISGFVRMDNDLQVKKPTDCFYLGLTYHLKY